MIQDHIQSPTREDGKFMSMLQYQHLVANCLDDLGDSYSVQSEALVLHVCKLLGAPMNTVIALVVTKLVTITPYKDFACLLNWIANGCPMRRQTSEEIESGCVLSVVSFPIVKFTELKHHVSSKVLDVRGYRVKAV